MTISLIQTKVSFLQFWLMVCLVIFIKEQVVLGSQKVGKTLSHCREMKASSIANCVPLS